MTAFELSETPIDPAVLRVRLARPEAGAFAVFEGWVRNEHRGREVRRLEYEVFPEMARTEGQAIVEVAAARFPGCEVLCVHRCGVAEVGELAVWIGATAGHRAAAFAACRLVIEEIKRRLPVWKKEHFAGAEPEWVDCTKEHNPALRREEFHSRQARLPEFGAAGQARLAAANVLVVGAGGLGCVAADTLAAAGVARLTVIDPGLVELSNLPRQSLYTAEDLGLAKAVAAEVRLRARNPFIAIEGVVGALQEYLEDRAYEGTCRPDALLFQSRQGGAALGRLQANRILEAVFARAGLRGAGVWGSHSLRKTFARRVYDKSGHDLELTRAALGHRNIGTTQRYLATSQEAAAAAILAL